ncbi:MAG: thioester reductase domain-containing protein [Myxococcota bacterium]
MKALSSGRLAPSTVFEPLWNQWYAWSYLLPPASASRYLTEAHLQTLQSFVEAPQAHVDALRDPAMRGGPFVEYGVERVDEVRALLERTTERTAPLRNLSLAIQHLEATLSSHPRGTSLEPLYAQVPKPLRGFVELVYDARDSAAIRFIEPLLYRSGFYDPSLQSVALRHMPDPDARSFVLSTPRLEGDLDCHLPLAFDDSRVDALARARRTPRVLGELAEELGVPATDDFLALFTEAPAAASRPRPDGVAVRYLGHACVLVETADVSILVDPLIPYANASGPERISYEDLPERIDYALITHNHQDHVMLETLLQLRHRIGTILVPRSQKGSILDPSMRLTLERIGFRDVREIDELESVGVEGGEIVSLPVLGEHGDLNIGAKNAYWIRVLGRSIVCAADSNSLDDRLYGHFRQLFGRPDLLFIGMECDGAPFTWSYGPLLPAPVPPRLAKSRRLDGSDAERALRIVDALEPGAVYVYAMGGEPWLTFITSIAYTPTSRPIVESDRFVEACRARGLDSARLLGRRDFPLASASVPASPDTPRSTAKLPAPIDPGLEVTASPRASSSAATDPPGESAVASDEKQRALTALLARLESLDVRLQVDGEQLRVNAPKGALTDELKTALREHKATIVALISGGRAPETEAGATEREPTTEWSRDVHLAADLAIADVAPSDPTRHDGAVREILLTGATGFIGAYLLDALLDACDARLTCLVRADDAEAGRTRIREAFDRYGLDTKRLEERVRVVPGDLAQPRLGLDAPAFERLARETDVIHHAGATVHHASPYAQLRAANVEGTHRILSLAAAGGGLPVHYVSTLSVLPSRALPDRTRFHEHDPIDAFPAPTGGYNLSKWVAEHLLVDARRQGLPVTVYRPGPVSGDRRSGAFNRDDFLYRLMSGYVRSGLAPDGETSLDILPVDFVAEAIAALSKDPASQGQTFHLLHPEPVSSEILFEVCREAGHPIERVPYATWFEHLTEIAQHDEDHPLYPLVGLFSSRAGQRAPAESGPLELPFETANLHEGLARAGLAIPPLDHALFHTYVRALLPADEAGLPSAAGARG